MSLEQDFLKIIRQENWWLPGQDVLVAVSGGVDSMVLLHLLSQLPPDFSPSISVVHVNHQLRSESVVEAEYVEKYCYEHGFPLFYKVWNQGSDITSDIENQARHFRYDFFEEILLQNKIDYVLTAHHGDDQAETVLMKITKGSQLRNLSGIKPKRQFNQHWLLRPLLSFSKTELYAYANKHDIYYFEDATNAGSDYQRSRLRQQVIPLLKQENPNFLDHVHNFTEQVTYATDIIDEVSQEIYQQVVTNVTKAVWKIAILPLSSYSKAKQYMFFSYFFQKNLIPKNVLINQSQLDELLIMINSSKNPYQITLASGWRIYKEYNYIQVYQEKNVNIKADLAPQANHFLLNIGEKIHLSPTETIELISMPLLSEKTEPKKDSHLNKYQLDIYQPIQLPLTIRHPLVGDRIKLKEIGYTKKISRIFIDKKIPQSKRKQTWLVEESQKNIIWMIPQVKSYLSIAKETDKIHYRLIYKKSEY